MSIYRPIFVETLPNLIFYASIIAKTIVQNLVRIQWNFFLDPSFGGPPPTPQRWWWPHIPFCTAYWSKVQSCKIWFESIQNWQNLSIAHRKIQSFMFRVYFQMSTSRPIFVETLSNLIFNASILPKTTVQNFVTIRWNFFFWAPVFGVHPSPPRGGGGTMTTI